MPNLNRSEWKNRPSVTPRIVSRVLCSHFYRIAIANDAAGGVDLPDRKINSDETSVSAHEADSRVNAYFVH
ncbi:hypothetical protein [Burkholderia singularis]|uniref:hypothetical protein n=1 Tax=Burkholderia singularis TaxID=1503053 RepID=UPI000F79963F|nr:hypothetical protein [Burkholderia singularis]